MTRQTKPTGTSSETEQTPSPERLPFEQHAAREGTPAHLLAAVQVHADWAPGQEVTADEYARAVKAAQRSVIR